MSVKLIMEEPVVARWGETMEEVGWGPWQYPTLSKADPRRSSFCRHLRKRPSSALFRRRCWNLRRSRS